MDVAEIRQYARDYLELDTEDLPDAIIDPWIRQGFTRIVRETKEWPGYRTSTTIDTIDGTDLYTPDVSFGDITQVFGPSGPIPRYGTAEAEGRFAEGSSTDSGEPVAWSFWDQTTIRFWPTPNAAYTMTLRGYRKPSLPGDSGEPDLPTPSAQDLLLDYVVAQANVQQDDEEKAAWFQNNFETGLKQLVGAEMTGSSYQPVVINGRRSYPYGMPPDHHPWPDGFPG